VKLRRPKDYQPIPGVPDAPPGAPGGAAPGLMPPPPPGGVFNMVPDGPNKIFIGGIPSALTDENVQDLLTTFGPLKHFHLVKDPMSNMPKGFAFCEYEDAALTDLAIEGLDKMDIGGKQLTVQRANIRSAAPGPPMGMPAGMPPPPGMGMGMGMGMMPPPPPAFSMPGVDVSAPVMSTRILVLMNMVTEQELRDDGEYVEIKEDVTEECSKFGQVVSIEIPRPQEGTEGERACVLLGLFDGQRFFRTYASSLFCVLIYIHALRSQCQVRARSLSSTPMLEAPTLPSVLSRAESLVAML
jgi:splicing factor U2AF subunit